MNILFQICIIVLFSPISMAVDQQAVSDAEIDHQIVDHILSAMKQNDHHESDELADSGEVYAQQLAASRLKHVNLSLLTSAQSGLVHHDGDSAEKTHYTLNGSLIIPIKNISIGFPTDKSQKGSVQSLAGNIPAISQPIQNVNAFPTLRSNLNLPESSTVVTILTPPKMPDFPTLSKPKNGALTQPHLNGLPNTIPALQISQQIIDTLGTIKKAKLEVTTKNDDTESKESLFKFRPYALRPAFFNIGQRDGINIQGYQTATNTMPNSIFGFGGQILDSLFQQSDEMPPLPHEQVYRSSVSEIQTIANPFEIFPGVILQNGKVQVTNSTEALKSLNSLIEEQTRLNSAGTTVEEPCNGAPVGCIVCSSAQPNSCSGNDGLQGPCWDVCPKGCEAKECITCNTLCKI